MDTYVPHHLIHELGQPDGVCLRACAGRLKRPDLGVGDMALVIRAVDIFAIPAGRECYSCSNPSQTESRGKCHGVGASAGCAALIVLGT
jgi:hypothetical protein